LFLDTEALPPEASALFLDTEALPPEVSALSLETETSRSHPNLSPAHQRELDLNPVRPQTQASGYWASVRRAGIGRA
jgi:hypothetical protein